MASLLSTYVVMHGRSAYS